MAHGLTGRRAAAGDGGPGPEPGGPRSAARPRRVLVDLTGALRDPRPSGTRRVLAHIVDGVDVPGVRLEPAALVGGRWVTVSRRHAAAVLRGGFDGAPGYPLGELPVDEAASLAAARVRAWQGHALREVPVDEVSARAEGYLLLEASVDPAVLGGARRALDSGVPTMLLHHDSLSVLHPRLVDDASVMPSNEHAVLAARADHVLFLSRSAQEEFERRVRRSPVPHAAVACPGVDPEELPESTATDPPPTPHFVCVGEVGPRRRTDVVVAAVERLRAGGVPARVTVVGRPAAGTTAFVEALRGKAEDGVFRWVDGLDDAGVARLVSGASALVFPGEHEGYGLPALEALALGTPVVTSASLPALEGLSPAGQVRLDLVDEESVLGALAGLSDPDVVRRMRAEARGLVLPGWGEFARQVEQFVAVAVGADPATTPPPVRGA